MTLDTIMPYLTASNATMAISAFLTIWVVVKDILAAVASKNSPKVLTAIDTMKTVEDKMKAASESDFIAKWSEPMWKEVEVIGANANLGAVSKLALFLGMLHRAYQAATQKPLSVDAVKDAEAKAAELSAQAKDPTKISIP